MVDPVNITNYKQTDIELQEFLTFAIAVAGKTAKTIASSMEKFYSLEKGSNPFHKIKRMISKGSLEHNLKVARLGRYTTLSKAYRYLTKNKIDLRTCTIEELEKIPGVGPKTSRFFILHSRKHQKVAVLDTHILKFMKDQGFDVPKSTPSGKRYLEIEKIFIAICEKAGVDVATADLDIWNYYSGNTKEVLDINE